MATAIEDFERRYLERARAGVGGRIDGILLGRETDLGQTGGRFIAGWWCRPGADPRVNVLANPWDDRPAVALYDEHAWKLTRTVLAELAAALDELHGVTRPLIYWDLLLMQWLHTTLTSALDRDLFIDTARALAPDAPVVAPPATLTPPATLAAASHEQLHDPWNIAFLRALCQLEGIEVHDLEDRPAPELSPFAGRGPRRLASIMRDLPVLLARRLVDTRLSRFDGRQITLLGAGAFTSRQLLALARDVPGLRVAPRRDRAPASAAMTTLHPGRGLLRMDVSGAKRLGPLLPVLVPRTALESHAELVRASEARCGPACDVLHRNYAWNDVENEFLGRSAAAGKVVAFGQHGGATFQLAVAATERHMHRDGRRYISWAASVGTNVRPAADPYVQTLRDTHEGGTSVLLVEWMTPPYSYVFRFTSTPLGNQVFAEQARLPRFVEAAGRIRAHLLLKGFPGHEAASARDPILSALPLADRRPARPAPYWMRSARLVVCSYPDTPFIEAMAVGVPTLGLWDTKLWEMRPDAAVHFDRLEQLGVVHSEPERCAAKLNEVYETADAWWASPEIEAARRAFLDRFALAGDWRREWSAELRELFPQS